MTAQIKFNRRTLPAALANYHEWPPCETSLLDSADLALFEQRRKALVAYLGGLRTAEIASQFGIERTEVRVLPRYHGRF